MKQNTKTIERGGVTFRQNTVFKVSPSIFYNVFVLYFRFQLMLKVLVFCRFSLFRDNELCTEHLNLKN